MTFVVKHSTRQDGLGPRFSKVTLRQFSWMATRLARADGTIGELSQEALRAAVH